jgi:aminopeptidase N
MKILSTLAAVIFIVATLYGQTSREDKENKMNTLFEQKKYYQLLAEQNAYFKEYPGTEFNNSYLWISAQRIYAWLALEDMQNLRSDLIRSEKVNPDFVNRLQMRFMIDDEYLVGILSQPYLTDPVLDPERDFRPKLTACDTVRGKLTLPRSCYDVGFYELSVSIDPLSKRIEGINKIYFTAVAYSDTLQVDLFSQFTVNSVMLESRPVNFSRSCNAILIVLDSTIVPGRHYCLEIEYAGTPQEAVSPPWNGGFVWKDVKGRYWDGVACEHLGASSWWPLKDHLSDKPDSMRITLRVPSGYKAISNGNLVSVKENQDKTSSYEWFVHYPINSYNVTYYLGDFVNFNEKYPGNPIPYQVDYYVLKSHLKKAKKYYSQTDKILEVFSELYGEYPFPADGAGFVEAPFEGMEHQGAIAIGTVYDKQFRPGIATDDYDLLLVHETAHEWWGNAVAVGDMADAWISEGFATYSELLFIEEVYGYQKYLDAAGNYFQTIFNAFSLVGDRDVNDNTFLTNDIYHKGAAMLNNLRCIINDDTLFFQLIKGFYREYSMKIATTKDFTDYVAEKYPADLTDFFHVFLYEDDPPVLEYSFMLMGGQLLFNYRWTGVGENFTMPFAIVINDDECIRLTGTTTMQKYTHNAAGSFYIPTPFDFNSKVLKHNSFAYFQTHLLTR